MRRHAAVLLVLVLALGSLAFAAGTDTTDESTGPTDFERGQSERLFLRWTPPSSGTSCGDDRYLSTVAGTDDVVCTQLYATGTENSFSTRDVEPILLDAQENVTGTIALGPAIGITHGVAVVTATVTVSGSGPDGFVSVGTHTEELIVTPATSEAPIDFDLDVDDSHDAKELTSMTITVSLSGPQVLPWDFNLNGASFFDVPFLVPVEQPTEPEPTDPTPEPSPEPSPAP